MPSDITESSTYEEQLEYLTAELDSPKRVIVDGVDVTHRSVMEDIARMKFVRNSALFAGGLGACKIQVARPPDALGRNSGV